MRFAIHCCPECGKPAHEIEERMLTMMELVQCDSDPKVYDYTGEYEDYIDSVDPVEEGGKVKLYCEDDHHWWTAWQSDDDATDAEIETPAAPWEVEGKALALLVANKMAIRWSYHKDAWVASMLHVETGNECQFVSLSPEGAIAGAHKKATTPKVKK